MNFLDKVKQIANEANEAEEAENLKKKKEREEAEEYSKKRYAIALECIPEAVEKIKKHIEEEASNRKYDCIITYDSYKNSNEYLVGHEISNEISKLGINVYYNRYEISDTRYSDDIRPVEDRYYMIKLKW